MNISNSIHITKSLKRKNLIEIKIVENIFSIFSKNDQYWMQYKHFMTFIETILTQINDNVNGFNFSDD